MPQWTGVPPFACASRGSMKYTQLPKTSGEEELVMNLPPFMRAVYASGRRVAGGGRRAERRSRLHSLHDGDDFGHDAEAIDRAEVARVAAIAAIIAHDEVLAAVEMPGVHLLEVRARIDVGLIEPGNVDQDPAIGTG